MLRIKIFVSHELILWYSGDMTMATWGGSTAQSVDSNEGESDEGEYDNNYEGDTTLQHTGMVYVYINRLAIYSFFML